MLVLLLMPQELMEEVQQRLEKMLVTKAWWVVQG